MVKYFFILLKYLFYFYIIINCKNIFSVCIDILVFLIFLKYKVQWIGEVKVIIVMVQ